MPARQPAHPPDHTDHTPTGRANAGARRHSVLRALTVGATTLLAGLAAAAALDASLAPILLLTA